MAIAYIKLSYSYQSSILSDGAAHAAATANTRLIYKGVDICQNYEVIDAVANGHWEDGIYIEEGHELEFKVVSISDVKIVNSYEEEPEDYTNFDPNAASNKTGYLLIDDISELGSGRDDLPKEGWIIIDDFQAGSIFTDQADSKDLNNIDLTQFEGDATNALAGNDFVSLPNSLAKWKALGVAQDAPVFDAGQGNDIIQGGYLNDNIKGGAGNDRIYGAPGKDTTIFSGRLSDYKFTYSGLSTAGGTRVQVVDKRGIDGTDWLVDVEVAKFADQSVPLAKWEFKVARKQDGDATISLYKNGKSVAGATGINAWYDDATPIRSRTSYEAIYRTDGSVRGWKNCIELADGETGASSVEGRKAIQIHGGSSPQNSEGCIVLSGTPLRKMLSAISADYSQEGGSAFKGGQTGLHLPIPIKVTVTGNVDQPKINLPNNITVSNKNKDYEVKPFLYLTDDGDKPGITKRAVVTFNVKGSSAKYGEDFEFGPGIKPVKGEVDTFEVIIGPNKHNGALPIKILADKKGSASEGAEKIVLTMTDIDLYNDKSNKNSKVEAWKPYVENATEKLNSLLLGDRNSTITIKADSVKSSQVKKLAKQAAGGEDHKEMEAADDRSGRGETEIGDDRGNHLRGGADDDTLHGRGGDDWILAGGGDDHVRGELGDDRLNGGSGDDRLDGGSGRDDLAGGAGDDRLFGGNGVDDLAGDAGDDRLSGGQGNDHLHGGRGRDVLTGGSNADTFEFASRSDSTVSSAGRDTIQDFRHAQHDRIDLHLIDADTHRAGNQAFHFIGDDGFSGKEGELRAVFSGANTTVSADVNGDGTADFAITVKGHITFQAGDFVL